MIYMHIHCQEHGQALDQMPWCLVSCSGTTRQLFHLLCCYMWTEWASRRPGLQRLWHFMRRLVVRCTTGGPNTWLCCVKSPWWPKFFLLSLFLFGTSLFFSGCCLLPYCCQFAACCLITYDCHLFLGDNRKVRWRILASGTVMNNTYLQLVGMSHTTLECK